MTRSIEEGALSWGALPRLGKRRRVGRRRSDNAERTSWLDDAYRRLSLRHDGRPFYGHFQGEDDSNHSPGVPARGSAAVRPAIVGQGVSRRRAAVWGSERCGTSGALRVCHVSAVGLQHKDPGVSIRQPDQKGSSKVESKEAAELASKIVEIVVLLARAGVPQNEIQKVVAKLLEETQPEPEPVDMQSQNELAKIIADIIWEEWGKEEDN
jgi:hypothetical protein